MNKASKKHPILTNNWKKILFSSIVLGALYAGGQYKDSVIVHADSNNSTSITFHDDFTNQDVDTINATSGQSIDLTREIHKLNDEGEDTTNVPTTYTPSSNDVIHINSSTSSVPSIAPNKYNLQLKVVDQNNNYIETKNYQSLDGHFFVSQISRELQNEGFQVTEDNLVAFNRGYNNYAQGKDYYYTLQVNAPSHALNIHYVDEHGSDVGTANHVVTNYGHTDASEDLTQRYSIIGDSFISNNQSDVNVNVKSQNVDTSSSAIDKTTVSKKEPTIYYSTSYNSLLNPSGDLYHTMVTIEDMDGNTIENDIVSSDSDSVVDSSYFTHKYVDSVSEVDNHGIIPDYLDLSKGPYTFKINRPSTYTIQNTSNSSEFVSGSYNNFVTSDHTVYNTSLTFMDSLTLEKIPSVFLDGDVNKSIDTRNAKLQLSDLGYDVSNVPDEITLTKNTNIIQVVPKSTEHLSEAGSGTYKMSFKVVDQFGNYIKTIYASTNDLKFDTSGIVNQVKNDGAYFGSYTGVSNTVNPLTNNGMFTIQANVPLHTLTINYVNQHNKTVYTTVRRVTNYGHTNYKDDENYYGLSTIVIDQAQLYIDNSQTSATVTGTTKTEYIGYDDTKFFYHDYGYSKPSDTNEAYANGNPNPNGYPFYTTVTYLDKNGNKMGTLIVSDVNSNLVASYKVQQDAEFEFGINRLNFSNVPDFIDLTGGPYVFRSTGEYDDHDGQDDNQDNTTQVKQPVKTNSQTYVVKIKPSMVNYKEMLKQSKRAQRNVKADTAKLKSLKKKMRKHATKKQKVTYKKLQSKLSSEKKAVKTYKNQEAKLTKYFKNVSIINRDNKQIKSLTAQIKRLKKKHSRAAKKQYAKATKALKKAKSSLKSATKVVNNYR